jgi:hypothetical protein
MGTSIETQIQAIEEEIFNTQKNKATEHHLGKLKAKLARLRDEAEKQKQSGGKGKGFAIKKSGDATVGIIGFPSIGKSTLLNQLTDAESKVGSYDFTTLDVIPGMLKYKGAEIQLLDMPGLISGAVEGKGRGREILSAVRTVDMILLMVDAVHVEQLDLMERELFAAGLRLNQEPPDVVITRRGQGGISVKSTVRLSHVSKAVIRGIASEFVINADVTIREDVTEEQLIDVFARNRVYVYAMVVINKIDLVPMNTLKGVVARLSGRGWDVMAISATDGTGLDELKDRVFTRLQLIRVYMKPLGEKPDFDVPLILREGQMVADACRCVHRDFKHKFRYALVWGPSAKHDGQTVGLDHVLMDEDVLTVVTRK